MSETNTLSRSLHDIGLSAWFGGTLANAVSLNRAAGRSGQQSDAGAVANAGWDRWTPVNAAAIGAHLVGSVGQLVGNKERLAAQPGVGTMALVKTGLTVAALAVTGYSRVLGGRISEHKAVPVSDGTTPSAETPPEVASAQRQAGRPAVGRAGADRRTGRRQLLRRRAAATRLGPAEPHRARGSLTPRRSPPLRLRGGETLSA